MQLEQYGNTTEVQQPNSHKRYNTPANHMERLSKYVNDIKIQMATQHTNAFTCSEEEMNW